MAGLVLVWMGDCFFDVASCMLVWISVGDAIFGFESLWFSALFFSFLLFLFAILVCFLRLYLSTTGLVSVSDEYNLKKPSQVYTRKR